MDTLEILKIVEKKLFESKKKLIYDTSGNKSLSPSQNWKNERKFVSVSDLNLLEENDGWNVADRDYVNSKISDVMATLQHMPSAPPMTAVSNSKNTNSIIIFRSDGLQTSQTVTFFNSGLFLKKNWNITEIVITCDAVLDKEVFVSMRNIDNEKLEQLCKYKSNPSKKSVIIGLKYKVPEIKTVTIELNSDKIPNQHNWAIQLTIEL